MIFPPLAALLILAPLPLQAAAPHTAPKPTGDPGSWVTINDYPREALDKHQEGPVAFSLEIDSTGNVTGCRIAQSSGAPSLDAATCALLFRRAHFDPARDAATGPVAGTFSSKVKWVYPARIEEAPTPQPTTPQPAPVELRGRIRDMVGSSILHVDANGMITQCDEAAKPYDNVLPPPDLCGIFSVGTTYGPPTNVHGKPTKRKVTLTLTIHDVDVQ